MSRVLEIIRLDHLQYHIVQRISTGILRINRAVLRVVRGRNAADPKHLGGTRQARVRLPLIEIDLFFRITYMSLPNDNLRLARAIVLDAQMPESSNRILMPRESYGSR